MSELERAIEFNRETKAALLTVLAALNAGQQKKLLRDEKAAALFERYGLSNAEG